MHFIKSALISVSFFLFHAVASAQFVVTGDDPGKLKWNYIDTESYRVIYPVGTDSLARVYAKKLEIYKVPVSRTTDFITGEGDGKIMPVILHPYKDANGSVAWMPRRMDLYTVPSAYEPTPLPWSTMLSIHESRHVTQMQFGITGGHKALRYIFGEGWNGLAVALYPGTTNMEGDAVIAETALTPSGRGRTADFLNYYWVAFDQGDFRGWFKWRYMSQLRYSPTYYALGYMTIGGYRYLYDRPCFMGEGLRMVSDNPLKFGCLYTVGKQVTGKNWEGAWAEISDSMYVKWKADADKRAPYIAYENVTEQTRRYTDYTDLLVAGDEIYAVKEGHVHAPCLVRIDSTGKEHFVCLFPYTASAPKLDSTTGKIYWSETVPDVRWTLKSGSQIRYLDGGVKKTVRSKKMLYNPAFKDGKMASVRYHNDGRTSVDVTFKCVEVMEYYAPDSLQVVETAWIGGKIYATAISDNGYGIYSIAPEGNWGVELAPQPVKIKDFSSYGNELIFTCDRTGVNELYHFNPAEGSLYQKTSTRYGASDFQYSEDGSVLYFSSQTLMGKQMFRTSTDSLFNRKVRFDSLYKYPIAELIKEQETKVAGEQGYEAAVTLKEEDIRLPESKRYRKVSHMINFHTWFPAYVSIDNIMNNLSFDPMWQTLALGVSGVFQNNLSTAIGEVGYSAHKDPYNTAKWRHSGHMKFTYSGLYPVFQFAFDINDRGARQYNTYTDLASGYMYMVDSKEMKSPYIQGKATMYIPFSFSRGGLYSGLIPKVSYSISNDIFNTGSILTETTREIISEEGSGSAEEIIFAGQENGKKRIRQTISASLRGYTVLPTANSQVYPRWGIGAEVGAYSSIESYNVFSPMGYAYAYGYVPGIIRTHGMKLTATYQTKLRHKSPFSQQIVDILPRGLSSNPSLGSHISLYNNHLVKATADYAIPIYIGDITLGGNVLAIKRLVTYPHFDYTFIGNKGLWSAGIDLTADLHAILTIEVPCSLGVTFSWNGGSAWHDLSSRGINMDKWFIGPIFNISL